MTHVGFIASAYAVTALVLVGLIAWVVIDARAQQRALDELERRGIRRGSGASE